MVVPKRKHYASQSGKSDSGAVETVEMQTECSVCRPLSHQPEACWDKYSKRSLRRLPGTPLMLMHFCIRCASKGSISI